MWTTLIHSWTFLCQTLIRKPINFFYLIIFPKFVAFICENFVYLDGDLLLLTSGFCKCALVLTTLDMVWEHLVFFHSCWEKGNITTTSAPSHGSLSCLLHYLNHVSLKSLLLLQDSFWRLWCHGTEVWLRKFIIWSHTYAFCWYVTYISHL